MSYNKNRWKEKAQLIKKDGFYYLPVSGSVINQNSMLTNLCLVDKPKTSIIIYGSYQIIQGDTILESWELTDGLDEFFGEAIKGQSIKYARFDHKLNLEVKINVWQGLKIYVTTQVLELPSDKWDYNGSNCWISGY